MSDDQPAYSDVEYVFEPHATRVPHLGEYARSLWSRRQFMMALADSDLRSGRQSTILGNLWSVLDPLFQAGIYFFLYSVLRGSGSDFLPVLIGCVFLFQLTSSALSDGGSSIRRSNKLVLNSTFPLALLPITANYKHLKRFVPALGVFVVLFTLTGGRFGSGIFLLPLLFVIQAVMNLGIALLVSTFTTLVPDAQNLMGYVGRILFFVTPLIYPWEILSPAIRAVLMWQPVFPLFAAYQVILSGGIPSFGLIARAALWAIVLFVVGTRSFLRHEREFSIHL